MLLWTLRLCINLLDLSKDCLKDNFSMPYIDYLVENTTGHELMTFMDAFVGYHQILMHPKDQESTLFCNWKNMYCRKRMSFGLKNTGATYQRLVNKMYNDHIGRAV